jgi:putative NIF3 family GTP cyclohydrolase 1 type 2
MASPQNTSRRKFVTDITLATAAIAAVPAITKANTLFHTEDGYTVGQIMDMFIKTVPGAPFENTVDTLKAGSRDMKVNGIVTAMFPTYKVIKKAISLGANFIVCHEPTFYNHTDDVSWLQDDDVYRAKADLLKDNNIAVWRNHDYIHHLVPDPITTSLIGQLDWKQYQQTSNTFLINPNLTLGQLIKNIKEKLDLEKVRFVGELSQSCSNILLMPGAAGGKSQIMAIEHFKPDVLVCGEISEWETAEYVRDAVAEGRVLGLVVIGHIASEEGGSEYMANWLRQHLSAIKVTHIPSGFSLGFA